MTKPPSEVPPTPEHIKREQRLAKALRENLRRRKAPPPVPPPTEGTRD
jgi:hypothetical protein